MVCQALVFLGLSVWLAIDGAALNPGKEGEAAAWGVFFAFILTLVIFGAVNQFQNWLVRRRLRASISLADEPDHDADRFRRIGTGSEDALEIPEIPLREEPRKLLRPPP